MKTAIIAGATGLVGNDLLHKLLSNEHYSEVIALTRRDFPVDHPKLSKIVTDMARPALALGGYRPEDVFCCLGTTMAKAGSKEKFYEVDFEFPLALALATRGLGARKFLLVSALGANKRSSVYYNRVKGELEEALQGIGFDALHIFRPSLLLGDRKERRAGEDAAKRMFKVFGFLIPQKYKGIEAGTVASAMVACASREQNGVFVHESKEMQLQWGTDPAFMEGRLK